MGLQQFAGKHIVALIVAANLCRVASADTPDIVPLTFINGLPFVTVTVGATSTRMMFDTGGALGMSLARATVDKAGSVTLVDHKTRFRDLNGQPFEVQDLVADQVIVGTPVLARSMDASTPNGAAHLKDRKRS